VTEAVEASGVNILRNEEGTLFFLDNIWNV
jgi:hypothetical protein